MNRPHQKNVKKMGRYGVKNENNVTKVEYKEVLVSHSKVWTIDTLETVFILARPSDF